MKKKTKRQITQVLLGIGFVFLAWLLISFNMPLDETTTGFLVTNQNRAISIVNNVTDNMPFYSFTAAIVLVSYYFYRYKK